MNMTVPSITAFYAALLGLLGAGLTVNVIVNRVRSKVDAGDGGVAKLAQAIRAHANFAEQAPLALIVLALAEMLGPERWWCRSWALRWCWRGSRARSGSIGRSANRRRANSAPA